MIDKVKRIAPSIILTLLVTLILYPARELFYERDEWQGLGNIWAYKEEFSTLNIYSPIQFLLGEGRFLASVVTQYLLGNFPFDVKPIMYFSIAFHSLNTVLVYYLANKYTESKLPSFLSAAFFATNSVAHEAVTWPGAIIGTLPATTLILLSTRFYLKFLERKKPTESIISFLLLYLSLFFKEIGAMLFLLFPIFAFAALKRRNNKTLVPFLVFAVLVIIIRVISLKSAQGPQDLFITGATTNFWGVIGARTVLYPLTSFSLLFIPPAAALGIARFIGETYYPYLSSNMFDLTVQTTILDSIALSISAIALILLALLALNSHQKDRSLINFWLLFVLSSFLPYVVISKTYSYLESRYYYLAAAGAALLIAYSFKVIGKKFGKGGLITACCLWVLLISTHLVHLKSIIATKVEVGNERRALVNKIQDFKPTKGKTVYFVNGDRNFYVEEGNPLPFQQGTGYTILVAHYNDSSEQDKLLKQRFLWDLGSQGYKEVGDYGFGYFWKAKDLEEFLRGKDLQEYDLVALYYNSETKDLKRVSWDDIRQNKP